jgi:Ca2+-transporting ATPase
VAFIFTIVSAYMLGAREWTRREEMGMKNWHHKTIDAVVTELNTDSERGLSQRESARRLLQSGPNKLPEKGGISPLKMLAGQFTDFMVMVLLGATAISWLLGERNDALAILAIVIMNALLGFVQEYRAEKSLAALKDLTAPQARVVREGQIMVIPASEVVPGDLLMLESGDRICADARIVRANSMEVDESPLTGESLPVAKSEAIMSQGQHALGDLRNMVFAGTLVTRGRASVIVTDTGTSTELGKIADMISAAESGDTPLQKRLTQLGKWLVLVCGLLCLLVGLIGILRGESFRDMFFSAVSLAVAAIPEGLPAIVTIALAIGVQRMIRRKAIIRRLPAVETLGCATVICSDKTGTLTENEMTAVTIYAGAKGKEYQITGVGYRPEGQFLSNGKPIDISRDYALTLALTASVLCNNSYLENVTGTDGKPAPAESRPGWKVIGDPTEGALLVAALKASISRDELEKAWRLVEEFPFESERKRMSVVCSDKKGAHFVFAKGAPESILPLCTEIQADGVSQKITDADRHQILNQNSLMAKKALRVLALAYKPLPHDNNKLTVTQAEQNLVFLGLVGMHDPPRAEAAFAIATCREAGIHPVMITGDHPQTAMAVAKEIGLLSGRRTIVTGPELEGMSQSELEKRIKDVSVFARVSPQHKLRIVQALKKRGEVVAMTGDGVNDAPAVKEADIGVAMGMTGTEVTKEAAAMIVTDDNFASIVAAVEEGRAIYANIRKFIRYLLGCNTGEILTMFIAAISGMQLPLLPMQILWTNLVTDGLPALALGVEAPEQNLMQRPPRKPSESIFANGLAGSMLFRGIAIGACTIAAFLIALRTGPLAYARTVAFTTLVLAQLIFAFECRSEERGLFENGLFGNWYLIGADLISLAMQLAVIYFAPLRDIFGTVALDLKDWGLIVLFSSLSMLVSELVRFIKKAIRKVVSIKRRPGLARA